MLTTIDLVLALGTKLAEILTIVLKKRATQEEKAQAQQLVQQYDWLKQTHEQIAAVLRRYNLGVARGYVTGNIEEVFPLCTYQGYEAAKEHVIAHMRSQSRHHELTQFDVLSVSLTTETVDNLSLAASGRMSQQRAEAYVCEEWWAFRSTGEWGPQDVICRYRLLLAGTQWKIDSCESFVNPEAQR